MLPGKQKPSPPSSWDWLQDVDLQHALEGQLASAARSRPPPRSRLQIWLLRLSTSILLWTCVIQLLALAQLWHPRFLSAWPPCFDRHDFSANSFPPQSPAPSPSASSSLSTLSLPAPRIYKNNGYLFVSCNGGLNQMRAAICDMVAVARHLNLTLILPELDKTSFWSDPSDFQDIFDVKHFIASLQGEVRIVKNIPAKYRENVKKGIIKSMAPISWSNEAYYLNQILPIIKKHHILHFSRTDTRLANNGLPLQIQKLRCQVNYEALKFTPSITELGQKLVKMLQAKGPYLALHLRYEMDMLAFSGCNHGCTAIEAEQLTKLRYAYQWWKEKIIDSEQKRLDGLCPLTPEETLLVLKALDFDKNTQIYIAAGQIYGGERRMAPLYAAYPNIVRKEMLLSPEELKPFQNRSSQMAALDYLVSVESNIFIPTHHGNMAKVVEGHCRYLGHRKTILLDRKKLVELLDQQRNGTMPWDEFSLAVRQVHIDHMGKPTRRNLIPDRPKLEDYFYANPEECLA